MNKTMKIIFGVAMVAVGVVVILDLSNLVDVDFFFDGWWSLFIIIPSVASLFTERKKTGSLFGIGVGVLLLLCAQQVIPWADIWKYLLAMFAIVWGLTMVFGKGRYWGKVDDKRVEDLKHIERDGRKVEKAEFSFGEHKMDYHGLRFEGAEVSVSFGAAVVDLRGSDLQDGAVLEVNCSFAGVEILVDPHVAVKMNVSSAFGGVDDDRKSKSAEGSPVLYVNGRCSFGGVEVK